MIVLSKTQDINIMKTTDITLIDPKYRVADIGEYNGYVNFCPYCYPEYVDLGIRDVVGFGIDSQGYVVEVDECSKCFQKSHHHLLDLHSYEIFLITKSK